MTQLITLQQIRDNHPCNDGWKKVYAAYGPDMTTTISLGDVAKSNDAQDAFWCIRCADFDRRDVIRAILPSVKRASIHTTDQRVYDCISAIEKWLSGDDTVDLDKAADAAARAADAAYAAARAAYAADAAYAAARAATRAATRAADAAYAARAARAAELKLQIDDIIAVWPLTVDF